MCLNGGELKILAENAIKRYTKGGNYFFPEMTEARNSLTRLVAVKKGGIGKE